MKKIILLSSLFIVSCLGIVKSQNGDVSLSGRTGVTTGVPFLAIAPDSRAAGMGEVGVATAPDINSQHWNVAKYAFIESEAGVSFSLVPWLRNIVRDINMGYLVGYYKINERSAVAGSFRHFSLGSIEFRDEGGSLIGKSSPTEYAFDVSYSMALSDKISLGAGIRYVHSNVLDVNITENSAGPGTGNAFASDLGFYYANPDVNLGNLSTTLSFGASISNLGSKMTYSNDDEDYIPTNLRLGAGWGIEIDKYNKLSFSIDFNKLLVPLSDTTGTEYSSISGVFKSFGDAPGGLKEELQEVQISMGAEYWYTEQLAVRMGYFHENANKGNRKFISMGIGVRYQFLGLDVSYLAPVVRNSPLANTLRFSLLFDIGDVI